jgi:DNA repair protein RadC
VEAIREAAAGVLFVHNHPSGNPLPSPEDVSVTRRLREVCALAGLRFVDHVIVGESGYFSFAEEGM